MKRYAVYYTPEQGRFAEAAAAWLGWDAVTGQGVPQPQVAGLPRPLPEITAEPRKYGFHGTIKPPFRLSAGVSGADLAMAVEGLAARRPRVVLDGLRMTDLNGFLAFVPAGDTTALNDLAAEVVTSLDPFRAALTEAEVARRRPERLTPRQRDLLALYGYPYVLKEFGFHLTLSGPLAEGERAAVAEAAQSHFAGLVPAPFIVAELCLMGEDDAGRFHLLQRYPLADRIAAKSR